MSWEKEPLLLGEAQGPRTAWCVPSPEAGHPGWGRPAASTGSWAVCWRAGWKLGRCLQPAAPSYSEAGAKMLASIVEGGGWELEVVSHPRVGPRVPGDPGWCPRARLSWGRENSITSGSCPCMAETCSGTCCGLRVPPAECTSPAPLSFPSTPRGLREEARARIRHRQPGALPSLRSPARTVLPPLF